MKFAKLWILALAPLVCAQPSFDVVSVRPRGPDDHGPALATCSPNGRFLSQGPIRQLLLWAYNIKPFQLSGVPSWDPMVMRDNTGLYQIEARSAGPISEDVCRQMVLRLMADRFKMTAHHESRETAAFALTVAKNGPKLTKAVEGDGLGNQIVISGRPMGVPRGATGPAPPWTMARLADFLQPFATGRPVVDRTGIEGEFHIALNFSPDQPAGADPPPNAGPDIRTAIQEQLGLRLDSVKVPFDYVVIDHIEKPGAN